jgi:multiple sugar transport system permease protein
LASSDSSFDIESGGPVPAGSDQDRGARSRKFSSFGFARNTEGSARWIFIWPTVLFVLCLSIFPLVGSLTLAFSNLVFQKGRIQIDFIGFSNFQTLLFGLERSHFLGVLRAPTPIGWAIMAVGIAGTTWLFVRAARSGQLGPFNLAVRLIAGVLFVGFLWLLVQSIASVGGRPGSLIVTMIYVFVGITIQYLLGLGLALLAVQRLPGRRFFRVVFLIPLTITPVGVGYMFRMMTDTGKGPVAGLWGALGLQNYTWTTDPWAARIAVIIGEAWQWTPFMFIVLLAALEAQDQEVLEAALVDGASRVQSFLRITLPAILPVSTTIILIRLIESFKIIDMPNILTGGGPGTATQSLTLQAYLDWRTLNLGRSAATAYILLIVVTIVATMYISFVRRRVTETV